MGNTRFAGLPPDVSPSAGKMGTGKEAKSSVI